VGQVLNRNFVPPADAQLWCVFRPRFALSKEGFCSKLITVRRIFIKSISDPARCSYSGGATCGLELELELSDRIGVNECKTENLKIGLTLTTSI
jgi:hypothetical protein